MGRSPTCASWSRDGDDCTESCAPVEKCMNLVLFFPSYGSRYAFEFGPGEIKRMKLEVITLMQRLVGCGFFDLELTTYISRLKTPCRTSSRVS